MRGKKVPARERARAVSIALVTGSTEEAARQTGIPGRSIREWTDDPEFAALRQRTKDEVADEWWAIVQTGFRRVKELLGSTEDAQKAATAAAIIADKMLLIRGEATVRSENRSLMDGLTDDEKRKLRSWVDGLDTAVPEEQTEPAGDPV